MTDAGDVLVFDTGPLRHFAEEGWLRVLEFLAGRRRVVIPESVYLEISDQARQVSSLHQVLEASWIEVDRSEDLDFLAAFATYENRLAVGRMNRGECGVLALGKVRGYEIVLDDQAARSIASDEGIPVTATLPLLCTAIRDGQLTVPMVEKLADDLLSGDYFLPFGRGGFRQWALEQGLVDYS